MAKDEQPKTDFTREPWTWHLGGQVPEFKRDEAAELAEIERHLDDPADDIDRATEYLCGPDRAVLLPWDYEGFCAGLYVRPDDKRLLQHAPRMYRLLKVLSLRPSDEALWREVDALLAEIARGGE